MKKIFSAFLLMTMMVFSVGSFVSCSDLENELAQVEGTTNDNAAAIESLNSELAALKTALSAAQADADAAMAAAKAAKEAGDAAKAEAEAAKAAAEQAKAEAIAAVMAEVEAIQTAIAQNVEAITNLSGSVNANAVEIEALQEEIKDLQTAAAEHVYAITNLDGTVKNHEMAIEDLKTELSVLQNTLANYEKNLKELNLFHEQYKTDIQGINYAITNLTTAVETNSADIQGLIEQFEEVMASVKAVNEALVAVGNVLSALTNQIQSVVYVPETLDGLATAQGYVFGTGDDAVKTDILVKMTYEVSPKGLANVITSENSAFSTVPVKAEPAEYFEAQVLSADPATGRVVVYAHIPAETDAYDVLTGENDDYENVALALNVADPKMISLLLGDEPEILDAGTYVQSAYTGVEAADEIIVDIYDCVAWYNTEDEEFVDEAEVELDDVEVSWNLAASSTRELFTDYEVRVNVDGAALTVAEASEFFGQDVEVAYGVTHVDYKALAHTDANKIGTTDAAKNNPFTVAGTDFATTVAFANVENVEDEELVDYNTVVTLAAYFNGATAATRPAVAPGLTLEVNYVIVPKQADIVLSNVEKDWVYTEGEYAWKNFVARNVRIATDAETQEKYFNTASAYANVTFPTYELDVLSNAGIENIAKVIEDGELKKDLTATWGEDDEFTATATLTKLGKKAVTLSNITGDKLAYTPGEETTYTFSGVYNYEDVDYTIQFSVVLGEMPSDVAVELGTFSVPGITTGDGITVDAEDMANNPALKVFETLLAGDSEFPEVPDAKFFEKAKYIYEVEVNGEEAGTRDPGYTTLALGFDVDDDDNLVDESVLSIAPVADYDNVIKLTAKTFVNGVEFTYTATINTAKPTFTFDVNEVKAPNAVATVTGKLDNDANKLNITTTAATQTAPATAKTGAKSNLVLEAIDLRSLVHVVVPEGFENDYRIKYELVNLRDSEGKLIKVGNYQLKETDFYDADGVPTRWDAYTTLDLPEANAPVNALDWSDLDVNELVFDITLVSATKIKDAEGNDVDNEFKTVTVTVKMPQFATLTVAPVAAKYEESKVNTINVVKALTVKDKFGNNVYNPYANTVNDLFQGYDVTIKSTGVEGSVITNNFFKDLYAMDVVVGDKDDVVVSYKDAPISHSQLSFDLTSNGQLTITDDDFKIDGALKFEVPVEFTYVYDNYGALKQEETVVITFSPEGTAVGGGMDADYETPLVASKQWISVNGGAHPFETEPQSGNHISTDFLFDFGKATVNFAYVDPYTFDASGELVVDPTTGMPVTKKYEHTFSDVYTMSYLQKTANQTLGMNANTYYFDATPYTSIVVKATDAQSGQIELKGYNVVSKEIMTNYGPFDVVDEDANGKLQFSADSEATIIKYENYTGTSVTFVIDPGTSFEKSYNCTIPATPVNAVYSTPAAGSAH